MCLQAVERVLMLIPHRKPQGDLWLGLLTTFYTKISITPKPSGSRARIWFPFNLSKQGTPGTPALRHARMPVQGSEDEFPHPSHLTPEG